MSSSSAHPCIAVGADHGGYALKEHLKKWLGERGYAVEDCGTHNGERCDYPVVAAAVAKLVAQGKCSRGIMVDGAGIGSSMMANKFPGVRAALCYDVSSARNSREHNDANVLTLGAGLIGTGLAEQIADIWLNTECTESRHHKRVAMIGEFAKQAASCAVCAPSDANGPAANLPLAQSSPPLDNAPPRDSGGSAAFQASANRWLNMDKIDNISSEDLDRVAARIADLLGSGGRFTGNQWCFGDVCIDASVARQWIEMGVARFSGDLGNGAQVAEVAAYIDHTLLKPDATAKQVSELCAEAREFRFASVCVNPAWVKLAARELRGSTVKVCTVVGFPLGASVGDIKAMEARRAMREGAREIDMVINIGALKGGDDETVFRDIRAVVDACEDGRSICKVIIETALLNDDEKVRACLAAKRARADFVKTSTGFASGGATAADVALMSEVVRDARMGVKASGGVRSYDDLNKMVRAGATRIGASAGVAILKEAKSG